jgi:hypothetical protein
MLTDLGAVTRSGKFNPLIPFQLVDLLAQDFGRMEDLKGIPRSQTILDKLPNLGNPKANYYQIMSVIRRNLREGVTFKDASSLRPNSELAPTITWPTRTIR